MVGVAVLVLAAQVLGGDGWVHHRLQKGLTTPVKVEEQEEPLDVSSRTTSFKLFLPRGRRRLTQLLLLPIALRTRLN